MAIFKKKKSESSSVKLKPADLMMKLSGKGEKLLSENLTENEKVLVKLQANHGQALVLTDKRLYVIKWGFVVGETFGGKCTGFEYRNIASLRIDNNFASKVFQVMTAANQDVKISIFHAGKSGTTVAESNSAMDFPSNLAPHFQAALKLGRELISRSHEQGSSPHKTDDEISKLERLADLKEKGVLTEEEFNHKKRQILGL